MNVHPFRVACLQKWKGKCGFNATYGVLLDLFIRTNNLECANVIVTLLGGTPRDSSGVLPLNKEVPVHRAPYPLIRTTALVLCNDNHLITCVFTGTGIN